MEIACPGRRVLATAAARNQLTRQNTRGGSSNHQIRTVVLNIRAERLVLPHPDCCL